MRVPVTLIIGAESSLHDDAIAWAEALRTAGGEVDLHDYPGQSHIFGAEAHDDALVTLARNWLEHKDENRALNARRGP